MQVHIISDEGPSFRSKLIDFFILDFGLEEKPKGHMVESKAIESERLSNTFIERHTIAYII